MMLKWMEIGGMQDTILDTEEIRDELLKIAFGIWNYVKNSGEWRQIIGNWIGLGWFSSS